MKRLLHFVWLLLTPLAALTASTDALPINREPITPQNFHTAVASGVWLVEYFSPYCGHCRAFASTWQDLVKELDARPDPGIQLAQVDCAIHGDFCTEMKVGGYPDLFIYKKGKFVESFKGSRTLENLIKFVAKHAEPTSTPTAATSSKQEVTTKTTATTTVTTTTTAAVPLFRAQAPRAEMNLDGVVVSLDEHSFQETLNHGPAFIKFYAPWCGHCKKLAPVWTQLARQMQHKLVIAEVNCEEHNTLCTSQDVKGYPSLYFYSNGIKSEYEGGRKLEKLTAFAERVSAPPIHELIVPDLEKHVKENPVIYLLLYSPSNARMIDDITNVSPLGIPPIYASSSREMFTRYSISPSTSCVLIALKDHDPSTAVSTLQIDASTKMKTISDWLLEQSLPTTMELDQDTFQSVMNAKHRPLVLIAATSGAMIEKVKEKLHDVAAKWKLRHQSNPQAVVFTWMDSGKWSSWLKSMYGLQSVDGEVGVVIADHQRLVYWDQDQRGQKISVTSASIFSTLEGIGRSSIRYKHSENVVERLVRTIGNQVSSLESYIKTHPLRLLLGLCTVLILAYLLLKRLLRDDTPLTMHSRLD